MGKAALRILLVVLLAHMFGVIGLLCYGLATGRLSRERFGQYLATWRGEKLVPPSEEEVVEEVKETPQDAAARIAAAQIQREMTSRELQMQLETLEHMALTLEAMKTGIAKERKEVSELEKQFADKIERERRQAADEGFRKALKNYSSMKTKLVKDDFMQMDDEEAVRYLAAMKSDVATEILEKFKTPPEKTKRLRLMRLLQQGRQVALNENG